MLAGNRLQFKWCIQWPFTFRQLILDQQWNSEDDAENERGDNFAHSQLHKAPLSQWDLQVPPK